MKTSELNARYVVETQSIRWRLGWTYTHGMSGHLRNKYKIAGPQTWELVRAAYLGGESAQVVAERYGVTVPAIRRRAWKEKWTKRDLAAALEARGIASPPPPAAVDYIEAHIPRAVERVAEDVARDAEMNALVDQIASSEDASEIAAAIERRALAQASAAMVQGRSKEAQALASMAEMMRKRVSASGVAATPLVVQRDAAIGVALSPAELEQRALAQAGDALARGDAAEAKALMVVAEQMRKRAEDARAAAEAKVEQAELDDAEREEHYMTLFHHAAILAAAMAHEPLQTPAAFVRMVKRWREINLGEGEEDAERRAKIIVEAQRRHVEGRGRENLPEDVRAYLDLRWKDARRCLDRDEPVGVVDKSTLRL